MRTPAVILFLVTFAMRTVAAAEGENTTTPLFVELDHCPTALGAAVRNPTSQLIRKSYELQPKEWMVVLNANKINLKLRRDHREAEAGRPHVNEVWYTVETGAPLTVTQARAALALFSGRARVVEAFEGYFETTRRREREISIEEAISLFEREGAQLQSVLDTPPKILLNDNIADGPVELPAHRWRRIYVAFRDYDPDHREYGETWNSVIFYRDGIKIRIAKSANLIHALSPTLAAITDDLPKEGVNVLDEQSLIKSSLERDGFNPKSINDVWERLGKAMAPVMHGRELEEVSTFASGLIGMDITSLRYEIVPWQP